MKNLREERTGSERRRVPEIRLFEDALPASVFERLVRAVHEVGDERLKRTYATTFWFPIDAKPANVAEEAIHVLSAMVDPPPSCAGYEWWLGRMRRGQKLRYHFDRDLTLRNQSGELVHPLFASVLYLNAFPSSPTVVLDQVPSLDGESTIPERSSFRNTFHAVPNHYVVFPGNRRHGVIPRARRGRSPRGEDDGEAAQWRLSLLVNYWERRPLPPVCIDYDGSIYGQLRDERFFGTAARLQWTANAVSATR